MFSKIVCQSMKTSSSPICATLAVLYTEHSGSLVPQHQTENDSFMVIVSMISKRHKTFVVESKDAKRSMRFIGFAHIQNTDRQHGKMKSVIVVSVFTMLYLAEIPKRSTAGLENRRGVERLPFFFSGIYRKTLQLYCLTILKSQIVISKIICKTQEKSLDKNLVLLSRLICKTIKKNKNNCCNGDSL